MIPENIFSGHINFIKIDNEILQCRSACQRLEPNIQHHIK